MLFRRRRWREPKRRERYPAMSRDAAEGGGALRPPQCVTSPHPLWHCSYPTRHNCTGTQETHHSQRIPPSMGLTPDHHPESIDAGDTHQHHQFHSHIPSHTSLSLPTHLTVPHQNKPRDSRTHSTLHTPAHHNESHRHKMPCRGTHTLKTPPHRHTCHMLHHSWP